MWITDRSFYQNGKHTLEYINCKFKKEQFYCTEKKIEITCRKMPKKNIKQYSCILGRISNNYGVPLKNICIKLINIDKNTSISVLSNEYGYFYFDKVCLYENFKIFAIDEFNNKSNEEKFILYDKCPKSIDLIININKNYHKSIIVGDIFNCKTCDPIENITVSLFKKKCNCSIELDYIVYTNKYGQFAFRDVCKGKYLIKTSAIGYSSKIYEVCIDESSQIVNLQICLNEDEQTQFGTISGLITDKNNEVVDYGDVILYKVENHNGYENLTPISFTKTNEEGVYLFHNIPKGSYKIKATKTRDF